MAVQEETTQKIIEILNRIGADQKAKFVEFDIETHTQGKYKSSIYTYKISRNRIALEYWFSAFSSRKEETPLTFEQDGDTAKLEADLRACLSKLQETVKRKKGIF